MPSVSEKQARFMAMMANNPKLAKKAGIPVKVAKEFHAADKRKSTLLGALQGYSSPSPAKVK